MIAVGAAVLRPIILHSDQGAEVFRFQLSRQMLSDSEIALFSDYLDRCGVDQVIWNAYGCLLRIGSEVTQPFVLRAYRDTRLVGAAFLMRCKRYGKTLFRNALLHGILDGLGLPCYVWLRVGFCAETIANPGFVANGEDSTTIIAAMLDHMRNHALLFLVIDRGDQRALHPGAVA